MLIPWRAALLLVPLSGCTLLQAGLFPDACDPDGPLRCDGEALVVCQDGFEIALDCGDLVCDPDRLACGVCGDGVVDPAVEQCDDGNTLDGDLCESDCTLPSCQNGVVDPGEVCYPLPAVDAGFGLPFGLTAADLNLDGDPDLITGSFDNGTATIFIQEAPGEFGPGQEIAVGDSTTFVAVGDLDNDGAPDLAVSDFVDQAVTLLFNDGAGNFFDPKDRVVLGTSGSAGALAFTDLNDDGALDILVATFDSQQQLFGRLTSLVNEGGRSFAPPVDSEIGLQGFTLITADIRGDEAPEAVIGGLSLDAGAALVQVLTHQGDGSFVVADQEAFGAIPFSLDAGDPDNDGDLDVGMAGLLLFTGATDARLYRNDGGDLAAGTTLLPPDVAALSGAFGDLDGDGIDDIALGNVRNGRSQVSAIISSQPGNRVSLQAATGQTPFSILLLDVDGDGDQDILSANADEASLSVQRNRGGGVFDNPGLTETTGADPDALQLADFDGDGDLDVVVLDAGNDLAFTLINNAGTLTELNVPRLVIGAEPRASVAGDFDEDGNLDLAVINEQGDNASILVNRAGNGSLAELADAAGEPLRLATALEPRAIAAGDMNNDGLLDLVIGAGVFGTGQIQIFLGEGTGLFTISEDQLTQGGVSSLALQDINGDNRLDVIFVSASSGEVRVIDGDGAGGLGNSAGTSLNGARALALADLNGDSRDDLAVSADDGTFLFLGDNNGIDFGGALLLGPRADRLRALDLNEDGLIDLLGTEQQTVALVNEGANFFQARRFASSTRLEDLAAGDLDGQFGPDLVTAGGASQVVVVSRFLP